jgi:tryptophanyl-tRNA synthetase
VMSMVTDVQRPRRTDPGEPDRCVAFTLHLLYTPEAERAEIIEDCRNARIGCVDCKKRLARHVTEALAPFRAKRQELAAQPGLVKEVLTYGSNKAMVEAATTMKEVRQAIRM